MILIGLCSLSSFQCVTCISVLICRYNQNVENVWLVCNRNNVQMVRIVHLEMEKYIIKYICLSVKKNWMYLMNFLFSKIFLLPENFLSWLGEIGATRMYLEVEQKQASSLDSSDNCILCAPLSANNYKTVVLAVIWIVFLSFKTWRTNEIFYVFQK